MDQLKLSRARFTLATVDPHAVDDTTHRAVADEMRHNRPDRHVSLAALDGSGISIYGHIGEAQTRD
jgi:hypothetical protein